MKEPDFEKKQVIISVSRRTDIPAFYSEWLFNRIGEGFVLVRNPMNFRQVRKIRLNPEAIDCMVFWTKNPAPMLAGLDSLEGYHYYFQFTLNAYGADVEPGLPQRTELLHTFKTLSEKIGPHRVVWRYDPILVNEKYSLGFHAEQFGETASLLKGCTEKVTISFIDLYAKTARNTSGLNITGMSLEETNKLAEQLASIAGENGMTIAACAEAGDFSPYGVARAKCIDDKLIERICGYPPDLKKDKSQRPECGCVASVDIGAYNTCPHGCRYCYANHSYTAVSENIQNHNPRSPLLIGEPAGDADNGL
jgi:hypothetical protein